MNIIQIYVKDNEKEDGCEAFCGIDTLYFFTLRMINPKFSIFIVLYIYIYSLSKRYI